MNKLPNLFQKYTPLVGKIELNKDPHFEEEFAIIDGFYKSVRAGEHDASFTTLTRENVSDLVGLLQAHFMSPWVKYDSVSQHEYILVPEHATDETNGLAHTPGDIQVVNADFGVELWQYDKDGDIEVIMPLLDEVEIEDQPFEDYASLDRIFLGVDYSGSISHTNYRPGTYGRGIWIMYDTSDVQFAELDVGTHKGLYIRRLDSQEKMNHVGGDLFIRKVTMPAPRYRRGDPHSFPAVH